ncbi:MAG: hypothetical protein NXI24_19610 [bacterium]|nr:hypothetical protein [bacterium]
MTQTANRRSPWIRIEAARTPAGDFNLARKIYHTAGLIIPLFLYFDVFGFLAPERPVFTREVCLVLLVAFIGLMFILDTLRFGNEQLNALFMRLLGPLLKQEESKRYNATLPYFLACTVLMLIFSDIVVVFACIYLMIGDPWAAYIGGYRGRVRFWNGKSLEGLLAFIVVGFLACFLFLLLHQSLAGSSAPFALLNAEGAVRLAVPLVILAGVTLAALAEFFSVIALRGLFDDNLVVPLAGALGILIAAWFTTEVQPNEIYFSASRLFAGL